MPGQEICLFWGDWQIQRWWSCMPRSEWSGWVQAAFTMLAIVIALVIPYIDHLIDNHRKNKDLLQEAINNYRMYDDYFERLDLHCDLYLNDLESIEQPTFFMMSLNNFRDHISKEELPSRLELMKMEALKGESGDDPFAGEDFSLNYRYLKTSLEYLFSQMDSFKGGYFEGSDLSPQKLSIFDDHLRNRVKPYYMQFAASHARLKNVISKIKI